jgi:predicted metalloprotease with PDZ domain
MKNKITSLTENAKVMRKAINIKILSILIFVLIFSMYQETPAQRKKPNTKTQTAEVKPVPPEISFTISMSKPWTHLLEVEMRVKWTQMPEKAELKMPVWTPGSYLIREYARHVQNFSVSDTGGNNLGWQKINKNTWQVETKGAKEIIVSYKVYANELTVRTSELNDEHAFITPPALLMFVKDQLKVASTVKINPYGNWKVATGLPRVAGQPNTFRAENFDILYDSPFEISDFKEISFTVQGKPHRFIVTGDGNYNLQRIADDTTKIIEESYKIFGDLPYDNYLFILNTRGGGGLEHLNSTALQWNKNGFTGSRYTAFLGLVAHEFFHLWNVKRIRPDALGPFDYENENYTRLLWVAEGATSYYEYVLMQRAGLVDVSDVLSSRASSFQALQNIPGRFETSLEEASFDAWIKYYRQDENSLNNQISYYDKGEIVNFLLDVKIRTESNGAKSLDDVMRYLYEEFAKKGKNFTPADYQKVSEMMAGKSLDDFFAKYVRGREEIDYNSILSGFGLMLNTGSGREQAYLGATTADVNGRLTVRNVAAGTPAFEQGLNSNDEIVAVDGFRANQTFLQSVIAEKKPGDKLKLTVFRFDRMREIEITLAGRIPPNYRIVTAPNSTDDQKRLYNQYFGME